MSPINIVGGDVTSPRTATDAFSPWLAIMPAPGVDQTVGHIALYSAYVSLYGKFLHAVFSGGVN